MVSNKFCRLKIHYFRGILVLTRVKDQGQDKDAKSSCCLEKHGEKVQNFLFSILKNKVAYKYIWFQMLILAE